MAKTNKTSVKRTFRKEELSILLLQESFARHLPLFRELVATGDNTLFGTPLVGKDWTFTVVIDGQSRELIVNVPPKKK